MSIIAGAIKDEELKVVFEMCAEYLLWLETRGQEEDALVLQRV